MSYIIELLPLITTWAEKYLSLSYNKAPLIRVANADEGYLENQILFISHYVLMMQIGNEISQKDRIKEFLDMQYTENRSDKIQFNFMGGAPLDVCVLANSIDDIDIADILGITGSRDMNMYRSDGRKWKKKNIDAIEQRIIENLEFDGYQVRIDVESDAGSNLDIGLEITPDNPLAYIRIVASLNQITKLRKKLLLRLATSDDFQVRAAVAGMKHINKYIVHMLLKDREVDVVLSLLSNMKALALIGKRNLAATLGRISRRLRRNRIKKPVEIGRRLYYTYERVLGDEADYQEKEYQKWRLLTDSPDFASILKRLGNAVEAAPRSHSCLSAFRSNMMYMMYLDDSEFISDWLEVWVEELEELQELD